MRRERNLVLNDTLNYVALVLRGRPGISLDRMRQIAEEVSEIEDAAKLKETILVLAEARASEVALRPLS